MECDNAIKQDQDQVPGKLPGHGRSDLTRIIA